MGDENTIRTLGDYSKPSHEGYKNTFELPVGNNMVPLRSDTIRERTRLCLFQFSLRDQASNWLERLPAGSITTWEDLTTRFLAQFFPPGRTAKLRNDILMFQQHHEESLLEAWSREEERSDKNNIAIRDNTEKPTETETKTPAKKAAKGNEAESKAENEETTEAPSSQPVEYYMKHRVNKKLIEGLVDNHRFNDSLSGARVRKLKGKTYNLSPRGPVYDAILNKKITRKEDIGGNFEIPCNIGGLKHMNALVDQGSDVNVMPLSTYMKLNDERPAKMDIKLSLASHSYIYPLRIAEDILVKVAKHVYPVDFVILDIKEDEKRPFILGTPFLTTAKAVIKFDKGTITLRSGKSKISFHRIPESLCKIEIGVKNDIDPIAPTMTINRLVLEWEEMIKLHLEREMKFNQ
ncbi:zinc finger, CCHC-type containing protein [Tanacetum coccineum]